MTEKLERRFKIDGMRCQSCVAKIRNSIDAVPGVVGADVTLSPPQAIVRLAEPIDDRRIGGAGNYGAESLTPESTPARQEASDVQSDGPRGSLYPLLLIAGFISGVSALVAVRAGSFEWMAVMETFMAGFFIVFGFFKLLDLRGFASMYGTYDLIARAVPAWAWIYPFVEVGLGVAYLLRVSPMLTNSVTLVLMLIGAAGVGLALSKKQRIRCACLGSVLNLPMTTITLVEDLGMAAMAAAMLAGLSM